MVWNVGQENNIEYGVTEMKMLRQMSDGVTREGRIRNGYVKDSIGVALIVDKMIKNRLRWYKHVIR